MEERTGGNYYIFIDNRLTYLHDRLGLRMSLDDCTRYAEERVEMQTRGNKNFDGCNITIRCECARGHIFAATNGLDIVVYYPKAVPSLGGLYRTVDHELIHAFDNCHGRPMINCENVWRSETRASYYGQCAFRSGNVAARKKCTLDGVMNSMENLMNEVNRQGLDASQWQCNVNRQEAEKYYNELMENPVNPLREEYTKE